MTKEIPQYNTPEYRAYAYERMKEANRGHNYQYCTDEAWKKLEDKGYKPYKWEDRDRYATPSEQAAKDKVEELRAQGNYSRILCGYSRNIQKIKMYTVIYKKK